MNDCLAFSTRHIAAKGKLNLILEDYIEVRHSESNEIEEEEKVEGAITIHSIVIEQDDPETKALKKKEVSEGKS